MSFRSRAAALAAMGTCLAFGIPALAVASAVLATPAAASPVPASPIATSPVPASPAAASRVPGGPGGPGGRWRSVTFGGVTVSVPASWPVVNLTSDPSACPRLDVHAVYLGTPGPAPDCPARLTGITETVQVQRVNTSGPAYRTATAPARVAGIAMLTNHDAPVTHTMIDIVARTGMQVSVTYRADLMLARRIQSSIRIAPGARAVRLARPASIGPAPQAGRKQNLYQGPGFDACTAPSAATMTQWLASPFRAVGVYIGGVNRACVQANLTTGWLSAIHAQGWSYFPFYVGLQASCVLGSGNATINGNQAAAQGKAAADDATLQAQALSIPAGSPIIYDMEAYAPKCDTQVVTFLSAWDSELHARGYQAGVYESFSNIGALIKASGSMTEPDVIHYADWDGVATTASSYMPANMWANHQRLHQYKGGHPETFGGVTLHIDSNQLDVSLSGASVPGGKPPHARFRVTAAVNKNGTAELFARAADHTLVHAWQRPPGGLGFAAFQPVGKSPSGLTSNPAVAAEANGNLAVFAIGRAGRLEHAWQQAGFPNGWEWGTPLPAPPGGTAGADPAAVRLPGGDLAVFVTTGTGNVAVARQRQPGSNTSWTSWWNLKGSCATAPAAVRAAGQVLLACVTASGTAATDTWDGKRWTGWSSAGSSPAVLTGAPGMAAGPGSVIELFAATAAGGIDYAWRTGAQTWTWGPPISDGTYGTTIVNLPAVSTWPDGQAAIFAELANGQLGYIRQVSGGAPGAFSGWQPNGVQPPGGPALGNPAGWINANGTPEVAVLDARAHVAVSRYSAGGWTGWTELAGGSF